LRRLLPFFFFFFFFWDFWDFCYLSDPFSCPFFNDPRVDGNWVGANVY
jgi:hypothetical protein